MRSFLVQTIVLIALVLRDCYSLISHQIYYKRICGINNIGNQAPKLDPSSQFSKIRRGNILLASSPLQINKQMSKYVENTYNNRNIISKQVFDVILEMESDAREKDQIIDDSDTIRVDYVPNTVENRDQVSQEVYNVMYVRDTNLYRLEDGQNRNIGAIIAKERYKTVFEYLIDSVYNSINDRDHVYDIDVYDGNELQEYGLSRLFQVWQRLIDIGSPIFGWWFSKRIDDLFILPYVNETIKENLIKIRAKDLKDSIVQSRSIAIIKSGQALSLRSDLVKNKFYLEELSKLQDEVGTFDNSIAMNIIQNELGADPRDIFEFDPILPIASASIGQVYRAKLKSTGALNYL